MSDDVRRQGIYLPTLLLCYAAACWLLLLLYEVILNMDIVDTYCNKKRINKNEKWYHGVRRIHAPAAAAGVVIYWRRSGTHTEADCTST